MVVALLLGRSRRETRREATDPSGLSRSALTRYAAILRPPFETGARHLTRAATAPPRAPGEARRIRGRAGLPRGVTMFDRVDSTPNPTLLRAATVNRCQWPLASP